MPSFDRLRYRRYDEAVSSAPAASFLWKRGRASKSMGRDVGCGADLERKHLITSPPNLRSTIEIVPGERPSSLTS
jgi:hypothetical protein